MLIWCLAFPNNKDYGLPEGMLHAEFLNLPRRFLESFVAKMQQGHKAFYFKHGFIFP